MFSRTLSRIALIAFVAAAGTAAVATAQSTDSVTTVPFEFSVAGAALPRDTYRITRLPGQMAVFQIGSERHAAIVIGQSDRVDDREATPRLIFNRYGDQYFLREVWLDGRVAVHIPTNTAEREAAARLAGTTAPEKIVVSSH